MLRKLIFLIVMAIFLTACGAAPAENAAVEYSAAVAPAEEGHTYRAMGRSEPKETGTLMATAETVPAEEKAMASDVEYFLFTRTSNTVTDQEGNTLLYERYCQPSFSSSDPVRSEWVGEVLGDIQQQYSSNSSNLYGYAAEYIELNGQEHFYSYSNYQELGITRHDSAVVSLISLSSLYSGGSHPNAVQTAYNLDIENQRLLRLEDVIYEDAAPVLYDMVRDGVDNRFSSLGGGLFEDYQTTIETSMQYGNMTAYWYLNDTGLVVFYNQYELGPYAAGIIKVELPYGDLEDVLLPEYFPAETDTAQGNLVLRGDWEGYRRIPITIESDGETLLVGVEGRIYQVRLSEVYWLDQTPITQEILFSAESMGQNDVLEITGGFTDNGRSFVIEFQNGQGEQKLYYLHTDGWSEEP